MRTLYPNRSEDVQTSGGRWEVYTREETEVPFFNPPDLGDRSRIVLRPGFAAVYFRGDRYRDRITETDHEFYTGLMVGGPEGVKSVEDDCRALGNIIDGYLYRSRIARDPTYLLGALGLASSVVVGCYFSGLDKTIPIIAGAGSLGIMMVGKEFDPLINEGLLRSVYYWSLRRRESLKRNLYGSDAMAAVTHENFNVEEERRLHMQFEKWKQTGFPDSKGAFLDGLAKFRGCRGMAKILETTKKFGGKEQNELTDLLLKELDKLSHVFEEENKQIN